MDGRRKLGEAHVGITLLDLHHLTGKALALNILRIGCDQHDENDKVDPLGYS